MSGKAAQPQAGQVATGSAHGAAELQLSQPGAHQQQQVQQQQPAAPLPLRLSLPSGRPPLPRSVPASATSSRASSPRSGLSAQCSLHTLNMNRQAQYRRALGVPLLRCCWLMLVVKEGCHAHVATLSHLLWFRPS